MDKVTKKEVLLYYADKLSMERRREIDKALQTSVEFLRLFNGLKPSDEEIERIDDVLGPDATEDSISKIVSDYFRGRGEKRRRPEK